MAEGGSSVALSFEKLKGRANFLDWKFQMKNSLLHDDLWNTVKGYPEGDETKEHVKVRKDERALSRINLMVEKCCFPYVMNCGTDKEAWTALERAFEDKGLNKRLILLQKLFSVKLVDYTTMDEYINAVMSISGQLSSMGKPVDDEFLGVILLKGLPKMYRPMVMALENVEVEITSDFVKNKLMQDADWNPDTKRQAIREEAALLSRDKPFKKKEKKIPSCWHCKEEGHFKMVCPKLKEEEDSKNEGKSKALFSAFGTESVPANQFDWYIDSGASRHMCSDEVKLMNFSQNHKGISVTVANGEKLVSRGSGNVPISLPYGNFVISDVVGVPGLPANLLSVRTT